jgi:hypothetical protein
MRKGYVAKRNWETQLYRNILALNLHVSVIKARLDVELVAVTRRLMVQR